MSQNPNQSAKRERESRANRTLLLRVIFLLFLCGVVLFVPLVGQLYSLQITQNDYYQEQAAGIHNRSVSVSANRGSIRDANGNVLAMSGTVYNLILSPKDAAAKQAEIDELVAENPQKYEYWNVNEAIVDYLTEEFGISEERVRSLLSNTKSAYAVIVTEITDEEAEEIRTFISEHKLTSALYLTPDSKRYYLYSATAAHVLGYTSENENSGGRTVGAYGLEAYYENMLAGKAGRVVTGRNASGTQMLTSYDAYLDAEDGHSLDLTIDVNIQTMAEQALETSIEKYYIQNGGFVIVMDPNTGAILADASAPDFDPNSYSAVTDAADLANLAEVAAQYGTDSDEYRQAIYTARLRQWRNKSLSDGYEPGSTFKALVVAAALEEGVISMDSTYYCPGHAEFGGHTIHCHKTVGHGSQTLTEALENSCNVALMEIGMALGADRLWDYFEDYGLLEKTGIDLPGEGNSVFWPGGREYFTSEEGISSLAVASFGQTFKITPVRMIASFASVINGGHLVTPYVVERVSDSAGNVVFEHEVEEVRQVLSENTSERLRGMLESVVANGTGQNAYNAGYRIGGKTGTSEKRDEEGDDVIVSFMGFAPADDPQVLVLIGFDSPLRSEANPRETPGHTYISGGNIAAPVAGALIGQIMDYLGMEKQYTSSEEFSGSDVTVPGVTGKPLDEAKEQLAGQNLTVRTVGDGDTVTGQIPAAGASIPGGSAVVLYLGEEVPEDLVTVPDLTGKTPTAVETTLNELGLYVRATGVSIYTSATSAADQSIAPGAQVSRGTVIEVRFVNDAISDYA